MNRISIRIAWVLAVAALPAVSSRPARCERAGAFPHLEAWPVSLALGGVPEALGTGVEAVLENPTGMLQDAGSGFAFSHSSLYTGGFVHHQAAALCWVRRDEIPKWREGVVTRSRGEVLSAYGLGVTNLSGELQGSASYGEVEISLVYARRVLAGVQSGLRLRFLHASSTVDSLSGSGTNFGFNAENGGFALDVGIEGSFGRWRVGGVARSVASDANWDRSKDGAIPRGFDIGLERDLGQGLHLLAGATLLSDGAPRRLALATSWRLPGTPLSLRAGPAWRDIGEEQRAELSAGMGARVGALAADYGMRTGPPGLGEIHRFSIRVDLP
jgi:hypothetical protein